MQPGDEHSLAGVLTRVGCHALFVNKLHRSDAWDVPDSLANKRRYWCSQHGAPDCDHRYTLSANATVGRSTELEVLLELERKLNLHAQEHPACVAFAAQLKASSTPPANGGAPVAGVKRNAFVIMLSSAAAAASRVGLEARLDGVTKRLALLEKEQRALVSEMQALEEKLAGWSTKRARSAGAPAFVAAEAQPWSEWALAEWRRQELMLWKGRRVGFSKDVDARAPDRMPRGEAGAMEHWRHGLIGAVQYWATGSGADAATLIHTLIDRLELGDELRERLAGLTLNPGLTFKRWEAQPNEKLIINSSEVRAVQGTIMEFFLRLKDPPLRPSRSGASASAGARRRPQSSSGSGAGLVAGDILYPPTQEWILAKEADALVRSECCD
jgi:hypothetical protein